MVCVWCTFSPPLDLRTIEQTIQIRQQALLTYRSHFVSRVRWLDIASPQLFALFKHIVAFPRFVSETSVDLSRISAASDLVLSRISAAERNKVY